MSFENWPDFCFSSGLESAGILWKSSFSLNSSEKKKIGKRSLKWFYHLEVELTVEILSIIPMIWLLSTVKHRNTLRIVSTK